MTDDPGVRDMLKFLLARDTMHQHAYQLWNFSSGQDSRQGRWTEGQAPDGRGEFGYVEEARPMATEPMLPAGDPRLYNTGSPPGPKAKKVTPG